MMQNDIELYSSEEEEEEARGTKKKKKKKRRFSEEQVRSLETIFSSETKLEQKKKVQVARDLDLQPRQVAIWFQNKRARWKSKQIQNNFKLLKANYDHLQARFQTITKENDTLLHQLQELHSLSEKSSKTKSEQFGRVNNRNGISELPEIDHQEGTIIYSDDDKNGNMSYIAKDEPGDDELMMNIGVNTDMISSSLKWCGFDATNLFDHQSSSNSHWWDSWT